MLVYTKLFIKSNRSHLIHFTKQGEGIGAQRKKRNECSPHKKMQVTKASFNPLYLNYIYIYIINIFNQELYIWVYDVPLHQPKTQFDVKQYDPMIVPPPRTVFSSLSPSITIQINSLSCQYQNHHHIIDNSVIRVFRSGL
jgi:hypothetical protein